MTTIMIIDDEEYILEITSLVLKKEGYDVVTASTGDEALKMLKTSKPDLILLDIMMPGTDGWEVCRKIKENKKTKDIPVATFTVRSSPDSLEKSLKYARADAQINKPFKISELLASIRRLLKEE